MNSRSDQPLRLDEKHDLSKMTIPHCNPDLIEINYLDHFKKSQHESSISKDHCVNICEGSDKKTEGEIAFRKTAVE